MGLGGGTPPTPSGVRYTKNRLAPVWAENGNGSIAHAFSGSPKCKMGRFGCQTRTVLGNLMWGERLHNPYLLGVPIVGRNQYGYITTLLAAQNVGRECKWLHNPCLLGVLVARHKHHGCIIGQHCL